MDADIPAASDDFPTLDQFLCFSIYSAGHALTQFYRPLLEKLGLTYPQYLLMVSLWAKDDQIVKDLGRALFLESSTLTPLIKRLEASGYLTRTRDSVDERQVRIRLTEDGKALKVRAGTVPGCLQGALGMPIEEIIALNAQVSGLRNRLLALQKD